MENIKILVICHKKAPLPKEDIYCPIEVGSSSRVEHFLPLRDDLSEDNISDRNPSYCELTGLYYAYKNLDYDVLGLVHYRRYFMRSSFCLRKNMDNVLDRKTLEKLLSKYDIILPKKRHYWIESNYSHYVHAHKKEALDKAIEIIKRDYPEYYPALMKHMKRTCGHYFNMFIAKKEIIDGYLSFLFDVLFKLEKEIDVQDYQGYDQRVFGFIGERLLDVYVQTKKLKFHEQHYLFMEKQNWPKKIWAMLKRHLGKPKE